MRYNDLKVEKNTRPSRKGRGISAGQGKTAGRGTKGQKSRSGHRKMPATFSFAAATAGSLVTVGS